MEASPATQTGARTGTGLLRGTFPGHVALAPLLPRYPRVTVVQEPLLHVVLWVTGMNVSAAPAPAR